MKLPVLKAIGTVFAFVLQHWLDILRIVWAPMALMFGVSFLIMPGYSRSMEGFTSGSSSPDAVMAGFGAMAPYLLGLMLVGAFVYLVVYAGLLKLVIRGEKPSLPFYLGFGADEMRLFGTFLLAFLIFLGAYIGVGLVVFIAAGAGRSLGGAAFSIITGFVFIAWCIAMVWLAIRLSLSAPAAIGAQKIGVGPSWSMTKGNAWRLFAYWGVWFVLLAILEIVIILITLPGYFQMIAGSFSGRSDSYEEMSRMAAQAYDFSSPATILRTAFGFVAGIVMMVFLVITGGVAYRLMSDEEQVSQF